MKLFRIPSLILAATLQLLPVARVTAVLQQPAAPLWAIIMRWAGAAAAALGLGSVQAVSGASTVITNPLTDKGTNGIPLKQFRLTTAPDQAHYWTASGLPSGVTLQGKSGQTFWALSGTPTEAGVFHVLLTAKDVINSGSDRTVRATLVMTIVGTASPPVITSQPVSQTVLAGAQVSFSVSATGTDPIVYQWRKDGQDISGATTSSLLLPSVSTASSGAYTVFLSNSAGSVLSNPAQLVVNNPVIPPAITLQPVSQSVSEGATVTLTVEASGTTPLTYQWKKNAQDILGAHSASLVLTSVTLADSAAYTVLVGNSGGTVLSDAATVAVVEAPRPPVITDGPSSLAVHAGQSASFTVLATGSEPLSYRWFHGSTEISQATESVLALNAVSTSDAGEYAVEVSNATGTVRSPAVTLSVSPLQILSITETTDATVITWNGLTQQHYVVNSAETLDGPWTTLAIDPAEPVNGVSSAVIPRDPAPMHFFRINTY